MQVMSRQILLDHLADDWEQHVPQSIELGAGVHCHLAFEPRGEVAPDRDI
jgi:hypothetical protein